MSIGVFRNFQLAALFSKVNSTLADVPGFTTPVAAGQKVKFRFYLPINLVGAAGGAKFSVDVPAAPALFVQSSILIDQTTATPVFFPLGTVGTIVAPAAVGGTLTVIGRHVAIIEGSLVNGVTAGNIKLQFAQNVTNATASELSAGAWMETWTI
jgi:hypothetical protein